MGRLFMDRLPYIYSIMGFATSEDEGEDVSTDELNLPGRVAVASDGAWMR